MTHGPINIRALLGYYAAVLALLGGGLKPSTLPQLFFIDNI